MDPLKRLLEIADKIRAGQPVSPVTTREFLLWFEAHRRGWWIVQSIREALAAAKIETEPDFESAYIDSPISFVVTTESPTKVEELGEAIHDPTYRISKLAAANNPPVSVTPDASVKEVITILLTKDFSQMPVMTNERDVKGMISWASIGQRLALGKRAVVARELMESEFQEIAAESSLFDAIPSIVKHQYVLIRAKDRRISGIVTASDLSLQFNQLAEPFLLLGEIENHIRRIIGEKFTAAELASVRDPADAERKIESAADLTFGEYIRLLENPDHWTRLNVAVDRATFCRDLEKVRIVRNDVMHFDPDPVPSEDLKHLRDFAGFLQRLQSIGVT